MLGVDRPLGVRLVGSPVLWQCELEAWFFGNVNSFEITEEEYSCAFGEAEHDGPVGLGVGG